MKCKFCDNEAKIFLGQMESGALNKVCLCKECADDEELMQKEGLAENFLDAPPSMLPVPPSSAPSALTCTCGFTLEKLTVTGRLGCSNCYRTFGDLLQDRIKSLHRDDQHVGKQIEVPESKTTIEHEISQVKNLLDIAINNEDFEAAAVLRDELSALEEKFTQYEL